MSALMVVQCRYDSSRLPGKAMMPIAGEPMLKFLLKRIKAYPGLNNIPCILATTDRSMDDLLAMTAESLDVRVVRGETGDVMARYCRCLNMYPSDPVIRITADNPLTCPASIKAGIEQFYSCRPDYLSMEGLPLGAGADIFASQTLMQLNNAPLTSSEREHINLHIINHPEEFDCNRLSVPPEVCRPDIRITIDTREDYDRITGLFAGKEPHPWQITTQEVISRIETRSKTKEMQWSILP